nr:MAG TPA: hypothetical protein [Caudoviricetes sp.]
MKFYSGCCNHQSRKQPSCNPTDFIEIQGNILDIFNIFYEKSKSIAKGHEVILVALNFVWTLLQSLVFKPKICVKYGSYPLHRT